MQFGLFFLAVNVLNGQLFTAVEKNELPLLKNLLKLGAQVNAKDINGYGQTPLMLASKLGNLEILYELIDHGANIDDTNIDGYSAMIIAAENGQMKIVEQLIKKGADLNASTKDGNTALILAAQKGQTLLVKGLKKNDVICLCEKPIHEKN